MVTVKTFCFNDFAENTFVVHDDNECAIIDPGCYSREEHVELINYIEAGKLNPRFIINTHCHIDHVLGVEGLKNHFNIPFYIGEHEKQILESVKLYAQAYGFPHLREPSPEGLLKEGQTVTFAGRDWKILFLPGHSPGHIGLYNAEESCCFSGDVLFQRSIGRTDLPGGNFDTLLQSIKSELFILPENTVVFPGHGPATTIEKEKLYNPFCGSNS